VHCETARKPLFFCSRKAEATQGVLQNMVCFFVDKVFFKASLKVLSFHGHVSSQQTAEKNGNSTSCKDRAEI